MANTCCVSRDAGLIIKHLSTYLMHTELAFCGVVTCTLLFQCSLTRGFRLITPLRPLIGLKARLFLQLLRSSVHSYSNVAQKNLSSQNGAWTINSPPTVQLVSDT